MDTEHRITIRSTKGFHRKIKVEAAKRGITIDEFLKQAVSAFAASSEKAA